MVALLMTPKIVLRCSSPALGNLPHLNKQGLLMPKTFHGDNLQVFHDEVSDQLQYRVLNMFPETNDIILYIYLTYI